MTIDFRLVVPEHARPRSVRVPRSYSAPNDDLRTILCDACKMLASQDVHVWIEAFDDRAWKTTDVELAMLLEQIPDARAALVARRELSLDFYEQGVERSLSFLPRDADLVEVTCASWHASWAPNAELAWVGRDELGRKLEAVARRVLEELHARCAPLAEHPWMRDWALAAQVPPAGTGAGSC